MITIDEAQNILDEIAEELPEIFFEELNGGILLLPDKLRSEYDLDDDLYVLGDYCYSSTMGRYINIYFGSFEELFADCSDEEIIEELRETLLHEFTHHLESLAGEDGLEIEDEIQLQAYLKSHSGEVEDFYYE